MTTQREGAAALRSRRAEVSLALAQLVAHWPKYAKSFAADPVSFAEVESAALVDYMAALLDTGDETLFHLYVGEKVKQFHDPTATAEECALREPPLLAGERVVFANALAAIPEAAAAVASLFNRIESVLLTKAEANLNLLFVGDCVYQDILTFLVCPLLEDGIAIERTYVVDHDLADIKSGLLRHADTRFDAVFISPFTYSHLPDYQATQRAKMGLDPSGMHRRADAAVRAAEELFDTAADLYDCPIIMHAPAPVLRHNGTVKEKISDLLTRGGRTRATRRLGESLRRRVAQRREAGQVVHLLDENEMVEAGGLREAGRYIYSSPLQHPARFGMLAAPFYRDILFVIGRMLKRKLVVCDLDNTLWEGVIGEGLGVKHHLDRQAPLLTLKERGVVLAINSKNDPAKVVWEAQEGQLRMEDFVSRQINWDPKPLNMKRIAEHLNLKEKDFVFVDDRADERALVDEMYPKMLTLDALDPRSWRLMALWPQLLPDKPGADRTDFYRQRDARQAFVAAEEEANMAERGALYAQLGLTLTVREAGEADVARVTELINRTNQFNMAGSRIAKKRVEELVASPQARVLIADAGDRFGPMGTISVLIAEEVDGRVEIPVFVLSCRVFGYGMEFALLEQVRRAAGDAAIFGHFSVTEHNQPCHGVYPEAGFAQVEGGWRMERAGETAVAVPDWLAIDLPRDIPVFPGVERVS